MTNGSGPHPKREQKKAGGRKKPEKPKPAAELLKKALKPRNGSGPKGSGG